MNICIITSHFPHFDLEENKTYATAFLADYAREWVKQGHQVTVIHLMRNYPEPFYKMTELLKNTRIKSLKKYYVDKDARKENDYSYCGIHIIRLNYKKYIPHGFTGMGETKRIHRIMTRIIHNQTAPFDVLIGDCIDPVLALMSFERYSGNRTPIAQIVHNSDINYISKGTIKKYLDSIDIWLFRSAAQKREVESFVDIKKAAYFYSGIAEKYIPQEISPRRALKKLLYVGALYRSKGLGTILEAMAKSDNVDLSLTVIGKGVDEAYFRERIHSLGLSERVELLGQISHDEVFHYMKEADALLLISHETFGMVYVEAMSQGCIPVGVINDGIDGVVIQGENGFLTKLGDSDNLASLLNQFSVMNSEQVERISQNAFQTACSMSQSFLAERALKEILLK